MRRAHGMTLIEVMVAIAIFSVLGMLSYRAVSSMIDARDRLDAEFSRWRAVARVAQLIENDLLQLAPRPGRQIPQPTLVLMRGGTVEELRLTRHDPNGGLQRRAWRADKGALVLARLPDLDDSATAQEDVLLDGVKSLRWTFITAQGRQTDNWPEGSNPGDSLPAGIVMTLDLADAGVVTRTFAIR